MIYSVKQQVSIDALVDRISSMQGHNIDWEGRTTAEMFNAIGDEMQKNLRSTVQIHEDKMRQIREIELRVIVHGYSEYSNKIQEMKRLLQSNLVPHSLQIDLINLFTKDNDIHIDKITPEPPERKYI